MSDRIGMNTSSESQNPCRDVVSVPADKSALSSYEIESSLRLATTALQEATVAAWKVRAQEDSQMLSRAAHMTQDPEAVSPFMQRLMLYCGLLALNVQELRSIVPTSPVTAVTDSSKGQESSSSSPPKGEPFSRSSEFLIVGYYDVEPSIGSVVLDADNDSWQRDYDGWNCANGASGQYRGWSWARLCRDYTLRLIYRNE